MSDYMVHDYTIPSIDVSRNAFVRNSSWKGTCDTGLLYPIYFDECLPGDTKQVNATIFGRLATPFVPVLDNIYCDVHFFWAPLRILWEHTKEFFGEKKNPSDSTEYLVPTINSGANGFARYGFFDSLGVPPAVPNLTCTSLVFYARLYNQVWNQWYRAQQLQDSVTEITGDTGDTEAIYQLLPRGKRQDYFTSGFTSTQQGGASQIPITFQSGTIPVVGNGNPVCFRYPLTTTGGVAGYHDCSMINMRDTIDSTHVVTHLSMVSNNGNVTSNGVKRFYPISSDTPPETIVLSGINNANTNGPNTISASTGSAQVLGAGGARGDLYGFQLTDNASKSGIVADLSQLAINAPTINSLRQAIAVQQYLERMMLSGCRYREFLLSMYGVHLSDNTPYIPEYLGGGTIRVNVSPVAQTSSTDSTTPQGNLAAIGTVAGSDIGFTKSFEEFGVIIGLASFRTDLTYQQGVDRHFLRSTPYDYYNTPLSHIGLQGVYNKEIYAQGDSVTDSNGDIVDNKIFNYNMRYDEYRFKNSIITGKFRSSDPQSLDVWHLSEYFENKPEFNDEFIKVSDTVRRITAVQSEPEFLLDAYFDQTDIRPVAMYGTPGIERI